MAKKKSKMKKSTSKKHPADLAEQLEQAFLAGLGALSNAQELGAKTFDSLVKQGKDYRKMTTRRTETLIDEVQDAIRSMAGNAQSKATGLLDQVRDTSQLEKLQNVFDSRVADALGRLGVPSKRDINEVNVKLDQVLAHLKKARPAAAKKRPTKKRKTTKKATKKTTGKPSKKVTKNAP